MYNRILYIVVPVKSWKNEERMRKEIRFFLCLICVISSLNFMSCYRMPTEEDYSVVPSINNPDYTREKPNNQMIPNVGF